MLTDHNGSEGDEDMVKQNQHVKSDDEIHAGGEARTSVGRPQSHSEKPGKNGGKASDKTGRPNKRRCQAEETCKIGMETRGQTEKNEADIESGRSPRDNGEARKASGRLDRDKDGHDADRSHPVKTTRVKAQA